MWIFGYGSLVWKADFPYIKKIIGYVKGYERKFCQASIDHRGVPEKPGRVVTLVPTNDSDVKVWGIAYKIHKNDINHVIRQLDLRESMGYERVPELFYPINNHPLNIYHMDSLSTSYDGSTRSTSLQLDQMDSDDSGFNTSNENEFENDLTHDLNTTIKNDNSSSDIESDEDEDEEDEYTTYENIKSGSPFNIIMYFGSSTNEHFITNEPIDNIAIQIYECEGFSGRNRDYLYNLADSMREICHEALDSHLYLLEKVVKELEEADKEEGEGEGEEDKSIKKCTIKL